MNYMLKKIEKKVFIKNNYIKIIFLKNKVFFFFNFYEIFYKSFFFNIKNKNLYNLYFIKKYFIESGFFSFFSNNND